MNDQNQSIEKWNSDAGRRVLTQLVRGEVKAEATFQRLGLQRWERSWLRRALRLNFASGRKPAQAQWWIVRSLAKEFDELREQWARRRIRIPGDQKRFRGNRVHLDLLTRSLGSPKKDNEWNKWRKKHPRITPDLRGANLRSIDLNELQLDHALLAGADLSDCNLVNAPLSHADLRRTLFFDTRLTYADLTGSDLEGAWLHNADLTYAKLQQAHLGRALLTACNLNLVNLRGTDLRGTYIWGCSYWGVELDASTKQSGIRIGWGDFDWIDLAITDKRPGSAFAKPEFTVEINDLRVADFMWQINDYPERVADMINAASSKLVLLLGRFRGKQASVLHDIADELRKMGYVPMVFDFKPPENRDVIESVAILAGLSKFVIADLTNPRSTPLESQLVVPTLAVPFIPIIRKGESAFSMFSALEHKYPWVRPLVVYKTNADLIRRLKREIVPSASRLARKLQQQKRIGSTSK